MDKPVEQKENSFDDLFKEDSDDRSYKYAWLKPWQFKPGVSGNPSGRPKGTISLKEYARKMLLDMDDDEKLEFMRGLDKNKVWEMAEGKPQATTDITSKGERIGTLTAEQKEALDKLLHVEQTSPQTSN